MNKNLRLFKDVPPLTKFVLDPFSTDASVYRKLYEKVAVRPARPNEKVTGNEVALVFNPFVLVTIRS